MSCSLDTCIRFSIIATEKADVHHDDGSDSGDEAPKKRTTKHDVDKPEPEEAE